MAAQATWPKTSGALKPANRCTRARSVWASGWGEGRVALLWLARALQVCPAEEADLRAAIRANLAACAGQFHHLQGAVTRDHGSYLLAAALSSDGASVLTGSKNGTARLWQVGLDQPLGPPLQ